MVREFLNITYFLFVYFLTFFWKPSKWCVQGIKEGYGEYLYKNGDSYKGMVSNNDVIFGKRKIKWIDHLQGSHKEWDFRDDCTEFT